MAGESEERGARATPMDVHIGERIRLRRGNLGLSQEKLGEAVGLTFQQIQKYERGSNRVSASRLHDLSVALRVPTSFFYDDLPAALADKHDAHPQAQAARRASGFAEQQAAFAGPPVAPALSGDAQDLLAAFNRITDPGQRRAVLDMVRALGVTSRG